MEEGEGQVTDASVRWSLKHQQRSAKIVSALSGLWESLGTGDDTHTAPAGAASSSAVCESGV